MPKPYLLILGASGLTGTALIRRLHAGNAVVRVTYREQTELNTLRDYGVEPFYADYEEPETVHKAMVGVQRLIMVLPIHPKFEDWGKQVIDAAKDARIEHLVALSNFIVDKEAQSEIACKHARLEQYLAESKLPSTVLRPATYFQNLLWATITIVRQQRFSLPLENAKLPHIDMRDVADALAAAALNSKQHIGKTYTLTGSEALSMFEVARLLGKETGKAVRYYPAPLSAAATHFRSMGMTEWISNAVAEIYQDYASLDLQATSDDFATLCDRPPNTMQNFLREYAAVFSGG